MRAFLQFGNNWRNDFFLKEKTDGSHTNRPFFRFKQDVRENTFFLDKSSVPQCLLFLFFKKRKRPLSEEKKSSPFN